MPDGTLAENKRPELIVGTQVKFYEYSRGQPLELLCAAKRAWDQLNVLIAVGYSFRDLGINRLIHYWLNGKKERKLVAIPHCRQTLLQQAAHSFARDWAPGWEADGKLYFYEDTDFKRLDWSEVQKFLLEKVLQ